ncbi:MAG: DUF1320 domain-containing protein [Proteobacteria bacterium]|nr:MAG: DUF1320 domain-containing protein [Pseudomonadota bacterium]
MAISVSNGLGGVGNSYVTITDLVNLSLPGLGDPAIIDAIPATTPPFNVNTKTLIVTLVIDSITQNQYTQTFTANYATVDLMVAAIAIPGAFAVNNGGIIRLRTTKVGIGQGITIDHTGTANEILGFDKFFDTNSVGKSTLTSDISEDEMTFAIVSASEFANGYLKRRYGLPLVQWSYDLIQAICDIAAYNLAKRKGFNPEVYDANWVTKYNAAVKWLEDVGNRREHPNIIDSPHNPVPYAGTTNLVDDQRGWGNIIGSRGGYTNSRWY